MVICRYAVYERQDCGSIHLAQARSTILADRDTLAHESLA